MTNEMIPISEIDSILKRYDRMSGIEFYGWDTYEDLIHELEELKQKAIPAIPISKIDEKINSLEVENNYCYECGIDYQEYAKEILSDLKNEN